MRRRAYGLASFLFLGVSVFRSCRMRLEGQFISSGPPRSRRCPRNRSSRRRPRGTNSWNSLCPGGTPKRTVLGLAWIAPMRSHPAHRRSPRGSSTRCCNHRHCCGAGGTRSGTHGSSGRSRKPDRKCRRPRGLGPGKGRLNAHPVTGAVVRLPVAVRSRSCSIGSIPA